MRTLSHVGRIGWLIAPLTIAGCGGPSRPTPVPPAALSLTCPADIRADSPDEQSVPVTFNAPQHVGGSPPVQVSCTAQPNTPFPVGMTMVTCTASDSLGQSTTCGFTVSVVPPPRLKLTRFLAFGDSLTEGKVGLAPLLLPVVFQDAYSSALQGLLSARYVRQTIVVIHDGVGGERVVGATEHSPGGIVRLQESINARRPEVLLLMEGSNDVGVGQEAAEMAIDGLQEMIEKAKERGVLVLLATIPPQRAGGLRHRDAAAALVPEFNNKVRALAIREGVTLVDVYDAMKDRLDLIGADDLHLTPHGYQVVAEVFFQAIKTTLEVVPGAAVR